MTTENIEQYFNSSIGMKVDSIFTTSDDYISLTYSDALDHALTLEDKDVFEWFEEWSGKDNKPKIRCIKH